MVANLTNANAASKVFRGDDDILVDQLIAVCQEHKAVPTHRMPGYGRELQPYFAEEELAALSSNSKKAPSTEKFQSQSTSPKTQKPGSKTNGRQPAAMKPAQGKDVPAAQDIYKSSPEPACPGMFSSPNPRDLPKPSTMLLRKATFMDTSMPMIHMMPPITSAIFVRAM